MFSKSLISVLALAVASVGFLGCEKKLDDDKKKASYAIGQQIGKSLKGQNIDFDPEVVAMSLKDASTGATPKLKDEELQQAMMKLQESVSKKQQEQSDKVMSEGKAYLEKNKSQAGVKTTASGLQYIVLTEGKGKTPGLKDTVKAHYKGTFIDGKEFDSSYGRGEPAEFPVSGVIKGWTEALQLMKVGGKMKLFIPSDLAYGTMPRPGIPPNSTLIFEVELLDVVKGK